MKKFDFLIIGSGIAGLTFALRASKKGKVAIITKSDLLESNTFNAQGGIASVISPNDSFESHIQDTIKTGRGLCNKKSVDILVKNGPSSIERLVQLGTKFTGEIDNNNHFNFDLGKEGGHSEHRIVHSSDITGQAISKALLESVEKDSNIELFPYFQCIDLVTEHHLPKEQITERCYGAYVFNIKENKTELFLAESTVLATGGIGQIYRHTTNPSVACGDGISIAYRAGAKIANMEFVQFHPTTLFHPKANSFLITEALRGHGAILVDQNGNSFMEKYDPMGSLAPRDVVAKSIDHEIKSKGVDCVFLDASKLESKDLIRRFPFIHSTCLKYGIDITKEAIPVVPAAHYICGGINVDEFSRTNLKNLYACGECSHTGVHGANRLASNSLLEAVVYSEKAGEHAIGRLNNSKSNFPEFPEWDESGTTNEDMLVATSHEISEIQNLMWNYVGIVRSDMLLQRALSRINFIQDEISSYYKSMKLSRQLIEVRSIASVAKLVITAAIQRKESRGLHYNIDYPKTNETFLKDTIL